VCPGQQQTLDQYLLPKGKVLGRPGQGWPWVYNNLLSVKATLDWLRSGRSITIPDDCRALVERATHADYLQDLAASLGGSWIDLWRDLFDEAAIKAQLYRDAKLLQADALAPIASASACRRTPGA
jgi:hypothetical protein